MGNTGDGYNNLPTVLSVFQSTSWWLDMGANVHVCADISMFFSYQTVRDSSVLMGTGHMFLFMVLARRSEIYFDKDRAAEERAACPYYQQESDMRVGPMQGRV